MSTEQNELQAVIQRVSYNKQDIERDAAKAQLAAGAIVQIVIDKVEYSTVPTQGKGPGEDFVQAVVAYPIDPRDGQTRLRQHRLFIRNTLPLIHPDYADTHIPPNWARGLWAQFCLGFIPERHSAIEYRDGQPYFGGKRVEREQLDDIELQRSEARLKEAVELLKTNGNDLLKRTAFTTIKHTVAKDGIGTYVNTDRIRAALGPTEQLTLYDQLIIDQVPGQNAANGNGATAAPKTASTGRRRR